MTEEVLINVSPRETRVAIVENGVLQEIHLERFSRRGLVGNIYKGKVVRVLPGMQAAFVDIGLERTAFLHVSDILPLSGEEADAYEEITPEVPEISKLLIEGQEILVQVIKDPLGAKGARLTTHLSITSRYLVYLPDTQHIGISKRIDDKQERERLKALVQQGNENSPGGYIIRTVAEGIAPENISADKIFLQKMWEAIKLQSSLVNAGKLVHEDLPLILRVLRDLVGPTLEKIRVDSLAAYQRMNEFAKQFAPHLQQQIELYESARPIFDLYGVEDEIQKALERKVALKSGGYLVIDQTEAMTTIDVNTGAFVGHRNLNETFFKTNLEATQAISRELRLRNLGGIIIIDFIDMAEEDHRNQVLAALEKALEKDYAKTKISNVSTLGLVEMSRKRTRESLAHLLCEPCSTCQGRSYLKTIETICNEIFREILREVKTFEVQGFLVLASQAVIDRMHDEESTTVADLEASLGKPIRFQVESLYIQEQFDVVLV